MSNETSAQILAVLGELKTGQEVIHTKLRRCEAILYGREEDDKPGLGERVRRIEDSLKDLAGGSDEIKELEKKIVELEGKQAFTGKLLWVIGSAAVTACAKLVASLF